MSTQSAEIFLHLDGRPFGGARKEVKILSVDDGTASVESEFADSGVALYRISDGRRLDDSGEPTPWDFWRLRIHGAAG